MTNVYETNLKKLLKAGISESAIKLLAESYLNVVDRTGNGRLVIFAWNNVKISLELFDPVEEFEGRQSACMPLPLLPDVHWERNIKGGFEAWQLPPGCSGRAKREKKIYLGYLGKRKLAILKSRPDFDSVVAQWIAEKRAEKGIA